jgi:hypothetical protein
MANTLGRTISEGEVVIASPDQFEGSTHERAFVCRHGYGMHADTIGTMMYGEWADGSGGGSIRGYWIDAPATRGWNDLNRLPCAPRDHSS